MTRSGSGSANAPGATTLVRDRLRVAVYPDRAAAGAAAGEHAAEQLRAILAAKDTARVIFAAAPSQTEMLEALRVAPGIDWPRVTAFHLDDYVALPRGHASSFGEWLDRHIWGIVEPGRVKRIDGNNPAGPAAEAERYGALLADGGIDLALIGVGENGHIAFNEPHAADFDDPQVVKPVELDDITRRQQVRDGGFEHVGDVPQMALTVTMSAIRAARAITIVVPGEHKAAAIKGMLDGPISTDCPASILRVHSGAMLFLDAAAAAQIDA